jgi:serine/threonine-protein kinase HipA
VLIGNADAHGKNLALAHPTPEMIELAPLYDTVPTVLWPKLRTSGAMSIDDHWELATVTAENLVSEASAWPLERERARQVVAETAEGTLAAAERLETGAPLARHISQRARALLS